jgi:Polysaccharide deacetylase
VTVGYVGSQREFWYDDLAKIFLCPGRLPKVLWLSVNASRYQWEPGPAAEYDDETYRTYGEWNMGRKETPTLRHFLCRFSFELLHPLPDTEPQNRLDYLGQWANMDAFQRPTRRTLSTDELVRLADGGLIEVGAQTLTHPVLAAIPLGMQKEDISQSKTRLEKILGCPVTSFAYPFGGRSHYTEETVAAVRESGFAPACSTSAGIVHRDTDRWQRPRFVVRDWDGDQFARYLEEWIHA